MIQTPALGFWHNPIVHGIIAFIVMVGPIAVTNLPAWGNLTISAVILGGIKYLQNKALINTGAVK